mgnify:CR=1 FL=1
MAKPNYGFEKRQRELAKKRKKEEKAAKKASGQGGDEMTPNDAAMVDLPTDDTAIIEQVADATEPPKD